MIGRDTLITQRMKLIQDGKAGFMLTILIFLGLAGTTLNAQAKPVAILEYFDNPQGVEIQDAEGFHVVEVYFGLPLSEGDRIRTRASTVELRLIPNGSIVKITPHTEFRVDALQGGKSPDTNAFTLTTGKIRTIAAKKTGSKYEIKTPSAVCGVRGTDFAMEVIPGTREGVVVREGTVEFARKTGEQVSLAAGQAADVFSPLFQPIPLAPAQLEELFKDLQFEKLNPAQVPQEAPPPPPKVETPPPAPPEPKVEAPKEEPETGPFDFLKDRLGMEIGSITINEETYSRLILQPTLTLGKLRAAFYLPIIYSGDILNSSDYYKPKGNNEWSFGTDKDWEDEPEEGIKDFFRDLALKIQFIEYGDKEDPFFFKVGNLDNLTLGHGSLVRSYANDTDFPAVRRVGLNLGIDGGLAGFEALAADLAEPEIFAGRFYFRPFYPFKFTVGLSTAMDFDPAGDLPEMIGTLPVNPVLWDVDPRVFTAAVDLDLPVVEGDLLSLTLFADAAGMIPYLKNEYSASVLGSEGFITKALFREEDGALKVRNYGILAGVMGHVSILDWRLEYRQYQGVFRPGYFDRAYERNRPLEAKKILDFLANPSDPAFKPVILGVYGDAGFTLFKKITFKAGYFWPWEVTNGDVSSSDYDQLDLYLVLDKGLFPLFPFSGMRFSFLYQRSQFIPTLFHGESKDLELFDAHTVVKSELVYPIASTLDIALTVTTTAVRNSDGTIRYDSDGDPEWTSSIGIETRIHF